MPTCDAKLAGAFGHCSTDLHNIWHGVETPAIACGRHTDYAIEDVFAGHRIRLSNT